MRPILEIYIHHTADRPDRTVEEIEAFHRARGFDGIGYHAYLRKRTESDGRWWSYQGREHSRVGAHCKGHNQNSLGIAIGGNYEIGHAGYTGPVEEEAINLLVTILAAWCREYLINPEQIYGHRDGQATLCPGSELYSRLHEIRSRVRVINTPSRLGV